MRSNSYVLLHQVGPHPAASVIHFHPRHLTSVAEGGTGISVDRLIGLGAMRGATEDEAQASVEFGSGDAVTGLRAFPAVPFQVTHSDSATGEDGEAGEPSGAAKRTRGVKATA